VTARPCCTFGRAAAALAGMILGGIAVAACGTDTVVAVSAGKSASVPPAEPATVPAVTEPGYLTTDGARLLDGRGNEVRLVAVTWFGFETPNFMPHGLWSRSLASMLDLIQSLGFVAIRIPFSNQFLDDGSKPNGFDPNANPDLTNVDALGLLDKVVDGAKARGLKIILDRHQAKAAPDVSNDPTEALWYNDAYPESRWIADFQRLATRYANNPTVVAIELATDLRDPATWGDGNPDTDFRAAAERAGNAILAVNPKLLVIVDGVQTAGGKKYWRGGNLSAAEAAPVQLSVPHRLVYGTQDYPESVADQPWFHDAAYPANLAPLWEGAWGRLITNNVAPVFVAGFGTQYVTDRDRAWLDTLVGYLARRNTSFAYWCINGDSNLTGGLLTNDWQSVNTPTASALAPILAGSTAP
jgi:endoglucanase